MADLPLGPGALTALVAYCFSLILVGVIANRKRVDDSLADH